MRTDGSRLIIGSRVTDPVFLDVEDVLLIHEEQLPRYLRGWSVDAGTTGRLQRRPEPDVGLAADI